MTAVIDLEMLKSKYFLVQDSRFHIYMYSADKLFYELQEFDRPKPLLEIPQPGSADENDVDIYLGDNKLIELLTTEFASNKH